VGEFLALGLVGTYWAAYVLESPQRAVDFLPFAVRQFLHSNASVAIGLGALVALGLYIGRWWAVTVAAIPLGALSVLQVQGHVSPFESATRPLSEWELLLAFFAVPIVVGVFLRLIWDRVLAPPRSNGAEASP
jgi:hypothetical protein